MSDVETDFLAQLGGIESKSLKIKNEVIARFIIDNFIGSYQSGAFTEWQVNIYAMNYLMRGNITQVDFDEIQAVLYPPVSIK